MKLEDKIKRSIFRAEKAYLLYSEDRLFFQALRIYKANLITYNLLEEFIFECEESNLDEVFSFLFHLEDWFEKFEAESKDLTALDDVFAFERFPKSPAFPRNFIESVLN